MANHSKIPTAKHGMPFESSERLMHGFQRFAANNAAGGILLILATVAALIWANSGGYDIYHYIFHDMYLDLKIGGDPAKPDSGWHVPHIHNLTYLINDFLMAIFFLFIGLEIKREIVQGELRSPKKAALPIAAAIGGMAIPALIYAAFNVAMPVKDEAGNVIQTMNGWGVPMATDIAFALGILMLLGKRAPLSLKVFLTSLAIVDDLGALLVIAMFYTDKLNGTSLAWAGIVLAALFGLNMLRFRHPLFYIVPGVALWVLVLDSGVHATIAGVLLALTIPARSRVNADRFIDSTRDAVDHFENKGHDGKTPSESSAQRAAAYAIRENVQQVIPPLHRMEHALHGWCAFFIIPVFAFANAGLHLEGDVVAIAGDPVTLGVFFGLVVGKPLGVFGASYLACKLGLASLPTGVSWRHVLGAGCLAGIGFTMALFIANLAFKTDQLHLDASKIGILAASLVSTILGIGVLMTCKPAETDQGVSADDADPAILEQLNNPDRANAGMPIAKAG
ncbi:MAG: Na+/H+ antiporter NhaA [Planctomycetota bacterium]